MDYAVTELPPVLHAAHQKARFGDSHVPSMTFGRQHVSGSSQIMRRLDELRPDPPLFGRPGVDEAEAWGNATLQAVCRRLIWWALSHRTSAMPSLMTKSRLPMPAAATVVVGRAVAPISVWRNGARDDLVRQDLAALEGHLDRIERWIDEGVIGTEEPTAADLQIGSVLALLLNIEDVAALIRPHERVAALAGRWFPDYPGAVPAGVFPADWLPAPSTASSGR